MPLTWTPLDTVEMYKVKYVARGLVEMTVHHFDVSTHMFIPHVSRMHWHANL